MIIDALPSAQYSVAGRDSRSTGGEVAALPFTPSMY